MPEEKVLKTKNVQSVETNPYPNKKNFTEENLFFESVIKLLLNINLDTFKWILLINTIFKQY